MSFSQGGVKIDTVVVQVPSPDDEPPQVVTLRPGTALRFGRGVSGCPVDIRLPFEGVSRLAGEIRATEDYWSLSNFSRDKTYLVDNPEGAGEYLTVAPRRLAAPVPFEFSRVVLPVTEGPVTFLVFAPQHTYADNVEPVGLAGDLTASAFPLDETAKYFLVLVALCEPRLRDSSTVALPTVGQIVERLRPLESCRSLTGTAVNYHIDYLACTKLRVKEPVVGGESHRLESKREALVSVALRFGLVRDEHRRLLPRRVCGSGD